MTNEPTLDRLIAHLRAHVGELRRLEREGAAPEEVQERKRVIARLQSHLGDAVRDLLSVRPSLPGDHIARPGGAGGWPS